MAVTQSDLSPEVCDCEWAERIRAGDRATFEALFRAHAEKLCVFARQYVQSPEVAEGLVQDLFVRLWERRRDFRPQGSITSYLYAAVRNRSLDHLRHREVEQRWKAQVRIRGHAIGRTPEEELHYQEFTETVQKAIRALPERRRLVFTLSRQHGLTYREIAEVLGISVKTVETQMSQAFKMLRQRLAPYLSFAPLLLALSQL